jgi:anti-sigma factor RsiW
VAITQFTDDDILAYLDEMLPIAKATEIEAALRTSADLRQRAAQVRRRQDQNLHSVGEIWRRKQLSCPTRAELGNYLLGALDEGLSGYVEFHVHEIGCRICAANLEDLQSARGEAATSERRRQKYFESSAGRLQSSRE